MVCFSERLCKIDEKVSLFVEYIPLVKIIDAQTNDNAYLNSSSIYNSEFLTNISNLSSSSFKRYFSCLSQTRIKDLRELMELDLGKSYTIYFVDSTLQTVLDDDLSLQDFVYIYTWNRRSPLHLYFTLVYVSSLDEDKPPVLEVEELLPQFTTEFSKITNQDENRQKKDCNFLSSPPLIDSELTIPRLAVSLPSSAFNNALRDGVHQPIITTFLPENNSSSKHSSTETLDISSQKKKRKKINSEVDAKVKKNSKKLCLPTTNSSSTSTQASSTIFSQNLKKEPSIRIVENSESTSNLKTISANNNCAESTSQQNVSLSDNSKLSASFIQSMSNSKPLTTSKLLKSKTLEQQFQQQLKQVQNSSTSNQNLSFMNQLSNLSSINNDNTFSQSFSSAQTFSKRLSDTTLSASPLTSVFSPMTGQQPNINNPDLRSLSPQQQEVAMRAYRQLMKISQNNDAMSACLLAVSNTTNSPPYNNFYNVMAAAASNQFLAALCNNVSQPTSLPSNKTSDLNLFSIGNVLNNNKKSNNNITHLDNLSNKIKQKSGQHDLLKKQPTRLNCTKETVLSNIEKSKTDGIDKLNLPSTSNKFVSKINNQKSLDQHKPQKQNSKTSFYGSTAPRLNSIGVASLLSANSS